MQKSRNWCHPNLIGAGRVELIPSARSRATGFRCQEHRSSTLRTSLSRGADSSDPSAWHGAVTMAYVPTDPAALAHAIESGTTGLSALYQPPLPQPVRAGGHAPCGSNARWHSRCGQLCSGRRRPCPASCSGNEITSQVYHMVSVSGNTFTVERMAGFHTLGIAGNPSAGVAAKGTTGAYGVSWVLTLPIRTSPALGDRSKRPASSTPPVRPRVDDPSAAGSDDGSEMPIGHGSVITDLRLASGVIRAIGVPMGLGMDTILPAGSSLRCGLV